MQQTNSNFSGKLYLRLIPFIGLASLLSTSFLLQDSAFVFGENTILIIIIYLTYIHHIKSMNNRCGPMLVSYYSFGA